MKITKSQLENIIREELALVKEAGDPIGPVEAQKMAELLQNLGFTLTRGGMNSFIEFLQGLENGGDLNASPDTRRGALAELALVREGGDLQNTAKGAAMELLDTAKVMSQAPSHDPASLYANEVAKQANLIMDALVQMEGGGGALEEDAYNKSPEVQEYDALTTMISRIDGMASFLLNSTRQASDEALTQQAAEQLNALRDTLSQLRKGL